MENKVQGKIKAEAHPRSPIYLLPQGSLCPFLDCPSTSLVITAIYWLNTNDFSVESCLFKNHRLLDLKESHCRRVLFTYRRWKRKQSKLIKDVLNIRASISQSSKLLLHLIILSLYHRRLSPRMSWFFCTGRVDEFPKDPNFPPVRIQLINTIQNWLIVKLVHSKFTMYQFNNLVITSLNVLTHHIFYISFFSLQLSSLNP